MRYGTSHFVSRNTAYRYYAKLHYKSAAVDRMIDEGTIHIGQPTLKPGQRLSVIAGEGRYQIDDGKP